MLEHRKRTYITSAVLANNMYCRYPTRYYRAPELLYGSRNYDPFAADIWSIGTILSDFFTNFVYDEHGRLKREPFLAGGDDNTFAVLSSIYRILGTPTESNWLVSAHDEVLADLAINHCMTLLTY
jgi:serine/threonine protein kinase